MPSHAASSSSTSTASISLHCRRAFLTTCWTLEVMKLKVGLRDIHAQGHQTGAHLENLIEQIQYRLGCTKVREGLTVRSVRQGNVNRGPVRSFALQLESQQLLSVAPGGPRRQPCCVSAHPYSSFLSIFAVLFPVLWPAFSLFQRVLFSHLAWRNWSDFAG